MRKNKKLEILEIECKHCHHIFETKNCNQTFCSRRCMYDYRKENSHETVICPTCKKSFERYKNIIDPRTGKPTQHCSIICAQTSEDKRKKLSKRFSGKNNNFARQDVIKKITKTKMK